MPNLFYGWVAAKPPILYYTCDLKTDISAMLPNWPIYRLRKYAWSYTAEEICQYHERALRKRPRDRLFHLVNVRSLADELITRGIPAWFVSHNCFLDERLIRIRPELSKQFDAVYVARMSSFKRHYLARQITNCLFLGGTIAARDRQDYFDEVRASMPKATYTHADNSSHHLSTYIVGEWLNRSRVGLCLSAKEGGMYAATEYMLCGLPVVSTASEGGRDEWFDPKFVRVVDAEEGAIAQAVRELIDANIDPEAIRERTIQRMMRQRATFIGLLQTIFNAEHIASDAGRYWYTHFHHKLGRWRGEVTAEVMEADWNNCLQKQEKYLSGI